MKKLLLALVVLLLPGHAHGKMRAIGGYVLPEKPLEVEQLYMHGVVARNDRNRRVNPRGEWPTTREIMGTVLTVLHYAEQYDLNAGVFLGVISTESGFRPELIRTHDGFGGAKSGSYGLGQLKPVWLQKWWPPCSHLVQGGPVRLRRLMVLDGEVNICLMAEYLSHLKRKYGRRALTVYNCGPRCRNFRNETRAVRKYWRQKALFERVGAEKVEAMAVLPPLIGDVDFLADPCYQHNGECPLPPGCGEMGDYLPDNTRIAP